jgi:NAD(P)-dependent dehydrogenase (short-subunit alcohol dehydrogenase family)
MAQKTALVTGASRGIGRGIAIELGRAGGRVAINYASNGAAAAEALALVRAAGGDGILIQGDVAVAADRARLVAETVAQFGRLDLLVNNAGVAPTVRADLLDAGEESFDRLYAINLKGPYFLTQLVAKQMLAQERDAEGFRGRIVTISSISAYTASINRGDYCVVKAGLGMMTKLFADRLANDGINVYEIRPGVIATDMTGGVKAKYDKLIFEQGITPIRRWGVPEDIGRAVRAIAEDRFPFSTGAVFDVDGGFHLHRL